MDFFSYIYLQLPKIRMMCHLDLVAIFLKTFYVYLTLDL